MKLFKKAFPGIVLPLLLSLSYSGTLIAQNNNRAITDTEKKQVVDKAFSLLKENYIFPEVIPLMEKTIRKKMADGYYSKFSTVSEFLKNISKDLETLSNDRHVNIFYDPIRVKQINTEAKSTSVQTSFSPEFLRRAKYENYMVRKAERLDGNVGYLKLDLFLDIRISKPTLIAAMNFLSNSSALIIDLRKNGGGHANTVSFLANYFLPDSTLTSEFKNHITKTTSKIYTQHDDLIQKFANHVPLYILVSKRTSSAAEGFAYDLQAFKRATVIGDTTNGEANPGYAMAINSDMWMMIPAFVNANAITKTNWQGVGVIPDVLIKSEKAFDAAQAAAYKQLSTVSADAEVKSKYDWLFVEFEAKINPVRVDVKELQSFTGLYANDRSISVDQENLYYQRIGSGEKKKLVPLSKDIFELDGSSFFRVRFIKDEKGQVVALEGIYDDGEKQTSKKL